MFGTLTVTIRTGASAMASAAELADAVRRVASSVEAFGADIDAGRVVASSLRDENGNTCGGWTFEGEA